MTNIAAPGGGEIGSIGPDESNGSNGPGATNGPGAPDRCAGNATPAWCAPLAAFVLLLLCHLWMVGEDPLARTEGHRVLPARQMIETGEYLIPRFYDEVYLRKPVGHYWTIAATIRLTGLDNEWGWRFPSVLAAALTAALCAFMARRWFGAPADWIAGLGFLLLVPIWQQSRTADIDAMNTLFSAASAFLFLDVGFGPARRKLLVGLAAGVAFGAMLLFKGPGGLPATLGVLIGASLVNRRWLWLLKPACLVALLVGLLLAGSWAYAVWAELGGDTGAETKDGIGEVTYRMFDLSAIGGAASMLGVVPAFGLPLTLALLLLPRLWTIRGRPREQALLRGLAGAFFAGLLVYVLSAIDNARYAYPLLTLIPPFAAGAWVAWRRGHLPEKTEARLRWAMAVFFAIIPVVSLILIIPVWKDSNHQTWSAGAGALAIFVAVLGIRETILRKRWKAAHALFIVLFALFTIVVADNNMSKRRGCSGREAGRIVVEKVNETGDLLTTGSFVRDKPEVFIYAGLPVDAAGEFALMTPKAYDEPRWFLFSQAEWDLWREAFPESFGEPTLLPLYRTQAYLVRYEPPRM